MNSFLARQPPAPTPGYSFLASVLFNVFSFPLNKMQQSSGICLPENLSSTDQNQTGLVKFARKHITAQDAGFRFGHKKRATSR
jgi:hypothetical protein